MANDNDFAALTLLARPYAAQCGDIEAFAKKCAQEVEHSGEPAFFLTTRKHYSEPHRFPASLEMWGYNETNGQSFVVAEMEISRPEYKGNPHGFKGNHLVVSLLDLVCETLRKQVSDGVAVFTHRGNWDALVHGSGYCELKAHRALTSCIPELSSDRVAKSRSRL